MIGKLVTNEVRIDYRKVAEPLTMQQINDDINYVRCGTALWAPAARGVIDEIIMWEHQWDWLTKPYRTKDRERQYLFSADAPKTSENTIFGIPVKVVEP